MRRTWSFWLSIWLGCIFISLALVGTVRSAAAGDRDAPEYVRTITDAEALELLEGKELDRTDGSYCEKARDVCLAALCGSLERDSTNRGCWEQCTAAHYQRCKRRAAQ